MTNIHWWCLLGQLITTGRYDSISPLIEAGWFPLAEEDMDKKPTANSEVIQIDNERILTKERVLKWADEHGYRHATFRELHLHARRDTHLWMHDGKCLQWWDEPIVAMGTIVEINGSSHAAYLCSDRNRQLKAMPIDVRYGPGYRFLMVRK